MKNFFAAFTALVLPVIASAQLIITNPAIPIDNQQVTITFDATKGDGGLKGYAGTDVYAHTGVITDKSTSSSDWKYVKAPWTTNLPVCKMTKISANIYQLIIAPGIRAFYGVPDGEKILKMAFVFRNTASTATTGRDVGGADIFTPVYAQGLNVSFINPSSNFTLVDNNQKIQIKVSASTNDSLALFLDNNKVKSITGSTLIDSVYASGNGIHTLISIAYKSGNTVADTVTYMIKGTTQLLPKPSGLHDGINYIDDNTVSFVLLAPFKSYIYLLGDFNNWTPDNASNLMHKDSNDTTRFWITMSGLTKGKEYIFQYFIDGSILIPDPYCEKISDPWNDKYIPSAVYPDLIGYPASKTTGIAGVIQTGQTPYTWQVTNFIPPDQHNLVIYELLIRDFTSNRDIKTVMDSLAYLKGLGINAIELMPFNEFDGNDSWGYNPCFYFAPDKAYGTPEDYKKFIDACHANGIAVIQDMVLDFSTNNSPLVQMYFANGKPTAQNPWYNINSPNTSYIFGNVFNHNSPYTRKLTDSITSFWMRQYKVDGFRFDFAKGWTNTVGDGYAYDLPRITNLKLAADHIWSINPKAYVILELFTDNSEQMILSDYGMMIWDNMNCSYSQASMGFASGSCSWDLSPVSYKDFGWAKPNLVGYMESHDEERLMYKNFTYGNSSGNYNTRDFFTAVKRQELTSCFFYTVPGPKMLWQFGELGYDIPINYGGRTSMKPIHWEYYQDENRRQLYNVTAALIKLKENEPVFSSSNFTLNLTGPVKQISISNGNTEVHVVGNFDVISNPISIHFNVTGKWYDYFRGDSINLASNDTTMTLPAGDFHIFSNRNLAGFGNLVFTKLPVIISDEATNIYPNPVSNIITIDSPGQKLSVDITSIEGKLIKRELLPPNKQIDLTFLDKGIYLLHIYKLNGESFTQKIIKL